MFLISRVSAKRGQVLATMLVFALSSGVLGGILFYMDWVGPEVLRDSTHNVPVDMEIRLMRAFYAQDEMTLDELLMIINEHEQIIATGTISYIRWYRYEPEGRWWADEHVILGLDEPTLHTFPNAIAYPETNDMFNDSTCWLHEQAMTALGLQIGDEYSANVTYYNGTMYTAKEYSLTIVGTFASNLFPAGAWWEYDMQGASILRAITTIDSLNRSFNTSADYRFVHDVIWANMDRTFILERTPEEALEELTLVRRRIEQSCLPYASIYQDGFNIRNAILEFTYWAITMRSISVGFSVPTIIMGVMLVHYNSSLLADEQRREIGTLKTRGSSGWQAFRWIMSSAIVIGMVGSIGAIGTGLAASLLSGTVRSFMEFNFSMLSGLSFLLEVNTIVFIFGFTFVTGILVAIPGAYKALTITAAEAHGMLEREALTKEEQLGNPIIDFIAFGISSYIALPFFMVLGLAAMLPGATAAAMLVIVPSLVIMMLSFCRLFARSAPKFKASVFERMGRNSGKAGARVLARSAQAFKKDEVTGVIFIALVFTAGFFSSISASSGQNHMQSLVMFDVGADIAVDVRAGDHTITKDLVDNITAIDGVAAASAVYLSKGFALYNETRYHGRYLINASIHILGVSPESWYESAFWLPYFAYSKDPPHSLSQLATDNSSILTSFQPVDYIGGSWPFYKTVYGNKMSLGIETPEGIDYAHCTIVDVLSEHEGGWGSTFLTGYPFLSPFAVINLDYLHTVLNHTRVTRFYVKLTPTANHTKAMQDIFNLAPTEFQSIESSFQKIESILDTRGSQTIYGIYSLNVVFALIYLTIGMAIVATMRAKKQRRQFSILRSLGIREDMLIRTVLIDFMLSVILAFVIGGILAVLLSTAVVHMPLAFIGSADISYWRRLPVTLFVPWPFLGALTLIAFSSALIMTCIVTRKNLQANIAEDIQYAE